MHKNMSVRWDNFSQSQFSNMKYFSPWDATSYQIDDGNDDSIWDEPMKWNKLAAAKGGRRKVVADLLQGTLPSGLYMSDLERCWSVIRETPNLDWILPTGSPENISFSLPLDWGDGYENVAFGSYVNTRNDLLHAINILNDILVPKRFLWVEGLSEDVGVVDLTGIDWVVIQHAQLMPKHYAKWLKQFTGQCGSQGVDVMTSVTLPLLC